MPSWAVAVHADVGIPGGIIVSSVYMESAIHSNLLGVNLQRLLRLGEMLRHYARPFAVAGDWNITPPDFEAIGL